jgi:hypothetical protein
MTRRHDRFGSAADHVRVDVARLEQPANEPGVDDFGPARERLPLWRRIGSDPQGTIVRADELERGDRALLNGGCFQQIAWIVSDDSPDRCVIGTEAGMSVRLWTRQLIVAIR